MNITLFTELTTNDHLNALQAEAEKYQGLYVDMNNAKERKYVKEKATEINSLLKSLDRKRIDLAKNYKVQVEKEAANIKESLEIANLPFTLLIDEYAAERKIILDAEKARKEAIIAAEKLEADHEFALLMNDKFDNDKQAALLAKIQHEQEIADKAIQQEKERLEREAQEKAAVIEQEKQAAILREQTAIEAAKQAEIDLIAANERAVEQEKLAKQQAIEAAKQAEQRRLYDIEQSKRDEAKKQLAIKLEQQRIDDERAANKQHVTGINRTALSDFIDLGINSDVAKQVITLIAKNKIRNITINY